MNEIITYQIDLFAFSNIDDVKTSIKLIEDKINKSNYWTIELRNYNNQRYLRITFTPFCMDVSFNDLICGATSPNDILYHTDVYDFLRLPDNTFDFKLSNFKISVDNINDFNKMLDKARFLGLKNHEDDRKLFSDDGLKWDQFFTFNENNNLVCFFERYHYDDHNAIEISLNRFLELNNLKQFRENTFEVTHTIGVANPQYTDAVYQSPKMPFKYEVKGSLIDTRFLNSLVNPLDTENEFFYIKYKEKKMTKITIAQKVFETKNEKENFIKAVFIDVKDIKVYRNTKKLQAMTQYMAEFKINPNEINNLVFLEEEEEWDSFE